MMTPFAYRTVGASGGSFPGKMTGERAPMERRDS